MSKEKIPCIFLDANIVIRSGKPPGGLEIKRVGELVEAGMAKVLTTDLTIFEIVKKHVENDFSAIKEICRPHFRKLVENVIGTKLPDTNNIQLKEKLNSIYHDSVSEMFKSLKAELLKIDDVKPTDVFLSYVKGTGLFSGEGKKNQFSDAFIFECLKKVAGENSEVIIVSDDGDFIKPSEDEEHLVVVKSLPKLFSRLGFEIEAPSFGEFLDNNVGELIDLVEIELNDCGLIGDIEDSEIHLISVNNIIIGKFAAFKPIEEGDPILVTGCLTVTANVECTHPNWHLAMYDSEDKILIPFEEISREAEVELEIDVSLSISVDENGQPEDIELLWFRNFDFRYVTLESDYEY